MLRHYISGVPLPTGILREFASASNSVEDTSLPLRKLNSLMPVEPVVRRLCQSIVNAPTSIDWRHRTEAIFDKYASFKLRRLHPDVVVCYENAALSTFRQAKRMGITTILDAASVHHFMQDKFFIPIESQKAHIRITERKDKEILLADHIITTSEQARDSYIFAGIRSCDVSVCQLGVDLDLFHRHEEKQEHNEVRFVYVGNDSPLKGLGILHSACEELSKQSFPFSMNLIGPSPSPRFPCFRFHGRKKHSELASLLPEFDVLVLPSKFESFGQVVVEAMACGLPVIVSDQVGAKELVDPTRTGLIFESGSTPQLIDAMKWFGAHRRQIPEMGILARLAVEQLSWSTYRKQVVAQISMVHQAIQG